MSISIPYTFSADTTILSAEVNSNFSTIGSTALNKTGDTISGNITVGNGITIDGVDLSVDVAKVGSTATVTGVWTFSTSPVFSAAITVPSATITGAATVGTTLGVTGLLTASGGAQFSDQQLARPELLDYSETTTTASIASNILTLDYTTATTFRVSLNAAITTFNISNPSPTGKLCAVTVIFTADGTLRAVTWPSGTVWPSAVAPVMTSTNNKRDIITLITPDAGTTWYGLVVGQNF